MATHTRPRTQELYESTVRMHLKPGLGAIRLSRLTAPDVQRMINTKQQGGASPRTLHACRQVLRAALSRAEREGLVTGNVAKLVELPTYARKPITPWTAEQARAFLTAATDHPWYGAYLPLLLYGLRRGEVLGLRWRDIDLDTGIIHVEQQLQGIDGHPSAGDVKTQAGRRALPLVPLA